MKWILLAVFNTLMATKHQDLFHPKLYTTTVDFSIRKLFINEPLKQNL